MTGLFKKLKQSVVIQLIKAVQKYGKHTVVISGNTYDISEKVFNPKYYYTSVYMAKNIKVGPDDTVLDVGTGSGIQAITAGKTASNVVAVDINPEAVRLARQNVAANGMDKTVSVIEGDLFSSLEKKKVFSVIIFTPPYLEGRTESDFDHALFDPDKILLRRFFMEAGDYLLPGGHVQMLYSSIADYEKALSIAEQCGWDYTLISSEKTFTERFLIYKLTQRQTAAHTPGDINENRHYV